MQLVILLLDFAGHKCCSSGVKLEKRALSDWSIGGNAALGFALKDEFEVCDDVFVITL